MRQNQSNMIFRKTPIKVVVKNATTFEQYVKEKKSLKPETLKKDIKSEGAAF